MENGPFLFTAAGIAIIAAALVLGRLFSRTARKQMPGDRRDTSHGVWLGARTDSEDGSDSHD